jgi:hypothetical protein
VRESGRRRRARVRTDVRHGSYAILCEHGPSGGRVRVFSYVRCATAISGCPGFLFISHSSNLRTLLIPSACAWAKLSVEPSSKPRALPTCTQLFQPSIQTQTQTGDTPQLEHATSRNSSPVRSSPPVLKPFTSPVEIAGAKRRFHPSTLHTSWLLSQTPPRDSSHRRLSAHDEHRLLTRAAVVGTGRRSFRPSWIRSRCLRRWNQ